MAILAASKETTSSPSRCAELQSMTALGHSQAVDDVAWHSRSPSKSGRSRTAAVAGDSVTLAEALMRQ
jgi:hypothetical protein